MSSLRQRAGLPPRKARRKRPNCQPARVKPRTPAPEQKLSDFFWRRPWLSITLILWVGLTLAVAIDTHSLKTTEKVALISGIYLAASNLPRPKWLRPGGRLPGGPVNAYLDRMLERVRRENRRRG